MRDETPLIGPYRYPAAACDPYDPRAPTVAAHIAGLVRG